MPYTIILITTLKSLNTTDLIYNIHQCDVMEISIGHNLRHQHTVSVFIQGLDVFVGKNETLSVKFKLMNCDTISQDEFALRMMQLILRSTMHSPTAVN